ncbi:Protein brunelleschi-like protein [Dinothrombium tinctorium]|uniref:Protein brunelleschi-like protein n=1 Tax=Dinothrombium tinctorium TaxID=1965070 RepID=A0A443R8L4_9ACAR|nr:Protein brunelleschi-like protein [Dinothrombium tinctorium]RWS11566.1 Protein brunelleschi-like protein [Dinothrombium tinctorium]RWS11603.1 Protein brunelleschi-like protein [Dinothrombium tinctorium]
MELFYASNKSILIEAKETCRIPVPVERCPLIDRNQSSNEFSASREALHTRCKAYLENQVHLKWSGVASISSIPWTGAMLDAILMSSLRWDVTLNGNHLKPEEEYIFNVGQLITISVKVTNCSDFQNGQRNYRLDMKRAIIGCDKVYITEIEPKEHYTHECSLIFFYSGSYKMDIQCTGFDTFANNSVNSNNNETSINQCVSSQQQQRNDTRERQKYQLNTDTDVNRSSIVTEAISTAQQASVWKYSPAIELSIIE